MKKWIVREVGNTLLGKVVRITNHTSQLKAMERLEKAFKTLRSGDTISVTLVNVEGNE